MYSTVSRICIVLAAVVGVVCVAGERAEACGCLSPPIPIDTDTYAVNQQAEQIIFEVEGDHVVAHVLIRYAGDPETFAWIVPVPSVPELSLSSTAAFGLLDEATRPGVAVEVRDLCPDPEYMCTWHPYPTCPLPDGGAYLDAGQGAVDAGGQSPPPVVIIDRQTIGSYDTVIFSAGDMQAAVDWLNQEGFIVNSTMAPFMQPYADDGMLFVASKLIPGADVSEIRPLRMRYLAQNPMIPLRLTAVAADPHLTVTAYVFGDSYVQPRGRPLVDVDRTWLSRDDGGRVNYPMVLARAIDEAGGDGFVAEYMGAPVLPDFDQGTGCCSAGWDLCGIEWDGQCSCPGNPLDAADCEAFPELLEGLALVEELFQNHGKLTRLTTRLSPEEMTADPVFEPLPAGEPGFGRLSLIGETARLSYCRADIIESARYQAILERQACATTYCGAGECVTTDRGAACACEPGTVARLFTDLDGEPSVTCVPDQAPVDYAEGGLLLPDACAGVDCGAGQCVDVGGFATCRCDPGAAAATTNYPLAPPCRPILQSTGTPGAQDYSAEVGEVRVCSPAPADCGPFGWLVPNEWITRPGESCASTQPDPARLVPPRAPTCEDLGLPSPKTGCGCRAGGAGPKTPLAPLFLLALVVFLRRRHHHGAGHRPASGR